MTPTPPPPPAVSADASFPAMLHSVQGLAAFSDILADFLHQWDSFLLHVNSIAAADHVPESLLKPNPVADPRSVILAASAALPVADPVPESEPKPSPIDAAAFPVAYAVPESEPKPNPVPDRERKSGDPSTAALGQICAQMGSRALRRFVTAHLRDRAWLRRAGPGALRRAPDPAALVLRAVSRYYICSESVDAEAACLLLLELYVRAGCPRRPDQGQGEAELWAEAREAALSWRSRIVREKGRVADASARDARGLILLMAAFGVPVEFPVQELYELMHAGGGLACAEVLKCSQLFIKKLRDVVADMLKKGIYHQAIGIILGFELQDAFPLGAIMTYIVEKVVHNRKDQEIEGQCDLAALKERDEEELNLLRSISKYVEDHTPYSSEISCISIAERIKLLEERGGKPKQSLKATKRKRTTEEDSLE